ncbi:DUF2103 domain-containing protein [Prochlorococcus sp. MIT 1300]|uniref:DUF2103 domain-containing protein n=1 Tax=Prochlorococcus sp. MIT 1300 TaxID=3096218 RepID=UPI002A75E5C6|nr:DUF2103 domain-containing protein [Prochlorococcus sp. MIT 1300]
MGRVVITHSTYIKGLIPVLKALSNDPGIKTITPGEIKRVKGQSPKLRLRISTSILGGYKILARRGTSAQEVFIITILGKSELEERVEKILKIFEK